MRIRKRKVPLPLSLLSPVPLSDPHLFSRSPVTLPPDDDDDNPSQPSDHHLTAAHTCFISSSDLRRSTVGNSTGVTNSSSGSTTMKQKLFCLKLDEDERVKKSKDSSKEGITTTLDVASANNNYHGHVPLSIQAVGRWCDGDRTIPLKKRRPNNIVDGDYERETSIKENGGSNLSVIKKVNKRGNTIMEGSRCSRVNGRGWRCCQPTLVGYSLCEHHLGKGRLRSMTIGGSRGVRGRPKVAVTTAPPLTGGGKAVERKKRVKLGVVKARSLSSLLGQTNTTSSTTNNSIHINASSMVDDHDHDHDQKSSNHGINDDDRLIIS